MVDKAQPILVIKKATRFKHPLSRCYQTTLIQISERFSRGLIQICHMKETAVFFAVTPGD